MRKMVYAAFIGMLPLLAPVAHAEPSDPATPASKYSVTSTLNIGGEGRWDYLTVGANHLLYVTRSTHTQVIDPAKGKVVADIAGGVGLHGTALVPSVGRAFISDGKNAKLLVVDLKTLSLIGKVDAAQDADGIIYDPGTDRILVTCGDAGQLLVLDSHADLATAKVEKIDLKGKPEFLAADRKGRVFVCINDKNEIAVVDLKTLKVLHRWPCGTGTAPTGLAIDPRGGRIFVGCRNQKLVVMSTSDGKVEAELPIGKGNDACVFDAGNGLAFASCGDGTLAVVRELSPGKFVVQQTVATRPGARTVALDPATHTLYLPTAKLAPAQSGERPSALPDTFEIVVVKAGVAH